jgi:hypothetical protein
VGTTIRGKHKKKDAQVGTGKNAAVLKSAFAGALYNGRNSIYPRIKELFFEIGLTMRFSHGLVFLVLSFSTTGEDTIFALLPTLGRFEIGS